MKLSTYFAQNPNPTCPFQVIGNGYQTSNIPKDSKGIILDVINDQYQIQWESGITETFYVHGGLAMCLDLILDL